MKQPLIRWRNVLGALVALVAVIIVVKPATAADVFTASVGQKLPSLAVVSETGRSEALSHLFSGRSGLVNFWAPWCPACKMELPDFSTAFPNSRIVLVTNDTQSASQPVLAHAGVALAHAYYDTTGQVFSQFMISTLPTTLFVNRYGIIVAKVIGPMNPALLAHDLRLAAKGG